MYLRIRHESCVIFLPHFDPLLGIRSTKVSHTLIPEFLFDSGLSNDIHLLVSGEFDNALDVDCRGVGRTKYFVNLSGDTETVELLLVGAPGLGRVIRNENDLLACFWRSIKGSMETLEIYARTSSNKKTENSDLYSPLLRSMSKVSTILWRRVFPCHRTPGNPEQTSVSEPILRNSKSELYHHNRIETPAPNLSVKIPVRKRHQGYLLSHRICR